ncbi:MAG: hypothetical protein EZS28_035727 [Streblomastix strix]|uniref:Uncharacterized protein n=1 Tax=Streblomastix strix TaxID=222440 RepID=A0A5J4UD86_9EUKA|nr:MAG: hypothetical protein EZS28_035727 [Streblomastix strix]
MRHCIEQDTQMMLHPIDSMIDFYFEFKVDMLLNTSLAKNSCQVKYSFDYKDFDLSESYNDIIYDSQDPKDDEATERTDFVSALKSSSTTFGVAPLLQLRCRRASRSLKASPDVKSFILTPQYWQLKVNDYNEQDKRFNYKNKPTLDRIDNAKAHTKANVLPCCLYCNKYASNRDKNEARLMIQLRRFALKYGLPMTISDQQVYKLCRRDLTGGISYVAHRENIAGETKINKFIYDKYSNTVHSFDLPHVMTHVYSLDFNSLYASVMSSEQHQSISYTNHCLYMPGYMNRIHYIYGDTDSMCFAIAEDENIGIHQVSPKEG